MCYLVSERVMLDWVLCCQTNAAEQNEEQDEVREDVMVDDLMAHNPESAKKKKAIETKMRKNEVICGPCYSVVKLASRERGQN